jgi:hypothetical protein
VEQVAAVDVTRRQKSENFAFKIGKQYAGFCIKNRNLAGLKPAFKYPVNRPAI